MDTILHDISRADDGLIQLSVSLGADQPRVFRASYDNSDQRCVCCSIEQELFMALSDIAFRRFGNCAVYQHELMRIIAAFSAGATIPRMPVALGTTSSCALRPRPARVAWNKVLILLRRLGVYRPRVYMASTNE